MQFYIKKCSPFRDRVFENQLFPRLRRKRLLCCYHIKSFLRAFGAKLNIGWGMLEVVISVIVLILMCILTPLGVMLLLMIQLVAALHWWGMIQDRGGVVVVIVVVIVVIIIIVVFVAGITYYVVGYYVWNPAVVGSVDYIRDCNTHKP